MRIIAVAGKGGVGKTTISALLVRHLTAIKSPVLAIDADPNSNLGTLLGIKHKETIADIREEAKNLSSPSFSRSEFFNMRLQEIVAEGKGVDLLVMGKPEGPGCYCAVNNILRDYLLKLGKNYSSVVIDNEAGMEHLSRRTAADIDNLLLVSDATKVGVQSAVNAFKAAKNVGIKIKDASVLINRTVSSLNGEKMKLINDSGLKVSGYFSFNEKIQKNSEEDGNLSTVTVGGLDRLFAFLEA